MANLPLALIEDIFSRVLISPLKAMKITCREWNALSKDPIFQKKHFAKAIKEIMEIKVDGFKLLLMSVNLHGIHNNLVDPFINQIGKLNQVKMSQVFHYDGLLLCVSESDPRLMVWNPYLCLCQIRWIQPTSYHNKGSYNILGYDNNKHHKVLRFCGWPPKYEIYDLKSNSWRDRYFKPCIGNCGVSLKGNNYFISDFDRYFRCFDFTKEKFERGLPLPYNSRPGEPAVLSVKEEQLAIIRSDFFETKIWITTKIEPTAVSWRSLLKFNTSMVWFLYRTGIFLVEDEKKFAVIYYGDSDNHKACVIEEDGYYEELDLGKSNDEIAMCSYVPSLMWIL